MFLPSVDSASSRCLGSDSCLDLSGPLSFVLCPFTRTFPAPARVPASLSGLPSGARLVGRPLRTRVCPHGSPHVTASLGRGPAPCMLSQVCHTHPLGSGGGIAHAPPTLSILSSFSVTAFTVVPYSRFPKFTWFTEVPCFLPEAFFTFVTFLAHRGHKTKAARAICRAWGLTYQWPFPRSDPGDPMPLLETM